MRLLRSSVVVPLNLLHNRTSSSFDDQCTDLNPGVLFGCRWSALFESWECQRSFCLLLVSNRRSDEVHSFSVSSRKPEENDSQCARSGMRSSLNTWNRWTFRMFQWIQSWCRIFGSCREKSDLTYVLILCPAYRPYDRLAVKEVQRATFLTSQKFRTWKDSVADAMTHRIEWSS